MSKIVDRLRAEADRHRPHHPDLVLLLVQAALEIEELTKRARTSPHYPENNDCDANHADGDCTCWQMTGAA